MEKKYIILSFLILSFFLTSCWEDIVKDDTKKDFIIETQNISEFWKDFIINKTWKIWSWQDIAINSQANGRVSYVTVKSWDYVDAGNLLLALDDNIMNYWLKLESAKNNLERVKLNYKSTEIKLDKAINDLNRDLINLQVKEDNSSSFLELEKIENTINKVNIDYKNLQTSNLEQIVWFKKSLDKDLNSFQNFLKSVITFSDEILWVTSENSWENDDFEQFLWIKNVTQLKETETLLLNLINYKNSELIDVNYDFEWTEKFNENILIINDWYNQIDNLLKNLTIVFDNSITSVGSLTDAEIVWYKSTISAYESQYSWSISTFVWLTNSINVFLETYILNEEALAKQLEWLEQDKNIYINWLGVRKETLVATLDETISNKDLTLKGLKISITDAEIAYKEALSQYNKLKIYSPISWTISDVLIDQWQEINTWTPLLSLTSNTEWEVSITLTKDELEFIWPGLGVEVNLDWEKVTWFVKSVSKTADSNLNYEAIIALDKSINLVWNIVSVHIPITTKNILLPIDLIETVWNWKGQLKSFSWNVIENNIIELWKFWGQYVEVLPWYSSEMDLIISEIKNYDESKYNLKLNNQESE